MTYDNLQPSSTRAGSLDVDGPSDHLPNPDYLSGFPTFSYF